MEHGHKTGKLSELVGEHYALVYRYAFRLSGSAADAEDLTQQTFLSAQTKLDQLRDGNLAGSWLCAIVRNTFLKTVRSRNNSDVCSLESIAEPAAVPVDETTVDGEELQSVLNEMPEEFRAVVILFYFEEFSYKDIAGQLEIPIGTVMSRLARGKSYLRRRLIARQPLATDKRTDP